MMKMNQFIHGDCIEVMKTLPSASFNCIVTSPPYNIKMGRAGHANQSSSGKLMGARTRIYSTMKVRINPYKDHDDNMPHDEYVRWQRDCLTEMMRLLKPAGAIFYNHKNRGRDGLIVDNKDILEGFPVRQQIIWERGGTFPSCRSYFLSGYEIIYLIALKGWKVADGVKRHMDVWKILPERKSNFPCPFPIELPQRCIEATVGLNTKDATVLDPFSGSGTTALAAERMGVQWIGIEKSQDYVNQSQERIEAERAQMQLI